MRDFQFYVTDDRYAVPSLRLVTAMSETDARRTAARLLQDRHHHAVEVWERGELLFRLGKPEPNGKTSHVAASREAIRESLRLLRRLPDAGASIGPRSDPKASPSREA